MKVIGLTGGFGTGKTFVAFIFKELGAKVIDADLIAHGVIAKGAPAYNRIVRTFGREMLKPRGEINRARLAKLVFSEKDKVKRLNDIVHPEVIRIIIDEIRGSGKDAIVVIDAPLLIETNLHNIVNELVVVKAPAGKQMSRCTKRFCLTKKDVLKRMESQMSLREKIKLADFVIDNSGTRSETRKQVIKVWREIVWK